MGKYVQHIVKELQLNTPWQFEVAGMMSQLGCVTLDTETIEAVYAGKKLSSEQQACYDTHAGVAAQLLSRSRIQLRPGLPPESISSRIRSLWEHRSSR